MERIRPILLISLLALVACSTVPPNGQWQSRLYEDHTLVGKIWDSRRDEYITDVDLLSRIEGASYLLLGEKHDNPDHHALQLRSLDHVIQAGRVASISFEMMNSEQQPLLRDLVSLREAGVQQLNVFLQWDNDGWNWDYYAPLLVSALQANVSINAANISNSEMMEVYGAPSASEIEGVLDERTMAALEKDIDESHCGMLQESQFPAMVRVQQARDHAMAGSLDSGSEQQIRVLIAGNYHIRRDLGVPNYLLNRRPNLQESQIVSLAFMEVDAASTDPADYLQQFGSVKAYDYIWFTPAVSDEDYCASLREQ